MSLFKIPFPNINKKRRKKIPFPVGQMLMQLSVHIIPSMPLMDIMMIRIKELCKGYMLNTALIQINSDSETDK